MKFNFQKNEYDRVHFERDFSFKEFYEKVLPIYKNVEKKASPQFQQSQLKLRAQKLTTMFILMPILAVVMVIQAKPLT